MSFAPANRPLTEPMFISPWSWNALGPRLRANVVTNPASATLTVIDYYHPFYLLRPYELRRFWWLNGATVGTDLIQTAVLSVDGNDVMDCVATSGQVLSAGTANAVQYAAPAASAHPIMSGTSTVDGTSFTTASVTLKARPGLMYALIFANSKASAAQAASAVTTTSGGVTFTTRVSTTYGGSTEARVSMWTAVPTADVTDTILIDFGGGNTQTGCAWTLVAFSNVDTSSNHGIVQSASGTGNSTTPLATLGALGATANCVIGANANLADTTTTPGTNFTEFYDINYATPTTCLQVQWSQSDITSDGTITSGQWGAIAAEVKARTTTLVLPPGRYYSAFLCYGTTATAFLINTALSVPSGIYQETPAVASIPLTATPTATTGVLVLHGITNRASP